MEYGYGYINIDNIYLTLATTMNTIDIRSIFLSTPLNKYKLKEDWEIPIKGPLTLIINR